MPAEMLIAYVITNRNGQSFWNRVGCAFVNTDGSINVKLESLPINGEIQLRRYVPRDQRPTAGAGDATNNQSWDDVF
jgi:hypothetical protein